MASSKFDSEYADVVGVIINAHIETLKQSRLGTPAPILFTISGEKDKPDITGNFLVGPKEHLGKMIESVVSQVKPQAVLLINEAHMVQLDLEEDSRRNSQSLKNILSTPVSKNPSAIDALVCMYVDKDTIAVRAVILKETESGGVMVSEDLGWKIEGVGGFFYEIGNKIQRILRESS